MDGGAATASLAGFLALSPIHERGTQEQVTRYKKLAAPPQPGENRKPWRGAFALTEPIPYVGVDTGMLSGKVRVAEWKDGAEPWLQVDKRGRFITGIAFANFVTAAVNSDDARIKGSCVVILEEDDEGTFDRGTATKKLVHQLSSTGDPVFNLKVPASRIVGGYTVKDGVIVPNFNHSEIIDAVFPPHARAGGPDDGGQAAVGGRAGDPLPAPAIPRSRGRQARIGALRAGHPAARRRAAPPGGRVGRGRGGVVAWLCRGAGCSTNSTRWKSKRRRS